MSTVLHNFRFPRRHKSTKAGLLAGEEISWGQTLLMQPSTCRLSTIIQQVMPGACGRPKMMLSTHTKIVKHWRFQLILLKRNIKPSTRRTPRQETVGRFCVQETNNLHSTWTMIIKKWQHVIHRRSLCWRLDRCWWTWRFWNHWLTTQFMERKRRSSNRNKYSAKKHH